MKTPPMARAMFGLPNPYPHRERAAPTNRVSIHLNEWQSLTPDAAGEGSQLRGLSFDEHPHLRRLLTTLESQGIVRISERRDGIEIETMSFVGRLAIGPIDLTITPKIPWDQWITLIGFGLRLRGLVRLEPAPMQVRSLPLLDLLILELAAEARDLLAYGLQRDYVRRRAPLRSPQGRIDFARIARSGGIQAAAIPCRYTRRSNDSMLNRALLAGLRLAGRLASDSSLRAQVNQLGGELKPTVTELPLSPQLLRKAHDALDRRTQRYEPSLRLIELLFEGQGATLEDVTGERSLTLPGFALDMNALWQRILSRVLREWSGDILVREEFSLHGIFRRSVNYPLFQSLPKPRPDFAVFKNGQLMTFLDAKYRDLWVRTLPRDTLYQLSLYAIAQAHGAAAILYPTTSSEAAEERIDVCDPYQSSILGSVALRPVSLPALAALIPSSDTGSSNDRRSFVDRLISGSRMEDRNTRTRMPTSALAVDARLS